MSFVSELEARDKLVSLPRKKFLPPLMKITGGFPYLYLAYYSIMLNVIEYFVSRRKIQLK